MLTNALTHHPVRQHARMRLLGVAFAFASALCAAILAGSFEAREQGRQPDLGAQIRSLRGVSSLELAEQEASSTVEHIDATLLANQAARARTAQAHEHVPTRSVFSEPVVGTTHHQLRSSL